MVIDLTSEVVRRWIKMQLIAARKASLSAETAAKQIGEKLDWLGMHRGFLPLELRIAPKLQSVVAVIASWDYKNYKETTVTVS